METITIQGTEKQINNFILDNELLQQEKDKFIIVETRVYVIQCDSLEDRHYSDLTDEEFMILSEEEGRVFTLKGFEEAFNQEEISTNTDVIRIINVEI